MVNIYNKKMKHVLIVVFAFCVLSTTSIAQQKNGSTAEVASIKPALKKKPSTTSKLYLLSTGDKTSEITKEDFKKIKKKDIEYVKELKDPVLLSMYGDKAKSGVVLVQMKQSPNEKKKKMRQDSSQKSGT
jgi:hypothetical protein